MLCDVWGFFDYDGQMAFYCDKWNATICHHFFYYVVMLQQSVSLEMHLCYHKTAKSTSLIKQTIVKLVCSLWSHLQKED